MLTIKILTKLQSKELFDCMDTLNTIKEKHFDETWGDYKIIPARPIW